MTRWTWVAAAAMVVALAGCGEQEPGRHSDAVEPLPAAAEGWRWQSFATLHFQVPDTWRRGSPDQWCADPGDMTPRVLSPDVSQTAVLCTHPFETYGARMIRAEDVTPDMADPDRTAAQAMGSTATGSRAGPTRRVRSSRS